MKLKVCGIRDNIDEVAALKPGYMGFIFYKKSKRYVGDDFSPQRLKNISKKTKKVAVFVNEQKERILEIAKNFRFDAIQLHGDENAGYCNDLHGKGFEIIKAFGIDESFDFNKLFEYEDGCDYFLFDTKSENYGGTGKSFNRELLKKYKLTKPFFLSGGIGPEEIKQLNNVFAIDINSKAEVSPGLKDIKKIQIIKQILCNTL